MATVSIVAIENSSNFILLKFHSLLSLKNLFDYFFAHFFHLLLLANFILSCGYEQFSGAVLDMISSNLEDNKMNSTIRASFLSSNSSTVMHIRLIENLKKNFKRKQAFLLVYYMFWSVSQKVFKSNFAPNSL